MYEVDFASAFSDVIVKISDNTAEEKSVAILMYHLLSKFKIDDYSYLELVKKLKSPHNQLSMSRTRNKKLMNIPENHKLLELLKELRYITKIEDEKSETELVFNVADIEN